MQTKSLSECPNCYDGAIGKAMSLKGLKGEQGTPMILCVSHFIFGLLGSTAGWLQARISGSKLTW